MFEILSYYYQIYSFSDDVYTWMVLLFLDAHIFGIVRIFHYCVELWAEIAAQFHNFCKFDWVSTRNKNDMAKSMDGTFVSGQGVYMGYVEKLP